MQSNNPQANDATPPLRIKATTSAQIVTANSVEAEEVPTIPIGSMRTVNALQPEVAVHELASSSSVRLPAPLIVHPAEYRRSPGEWLRVWWNGLRPSYLPLSLLPIILGSVLAWTQSISANAVRGSFHPQRFVVLLLAVLFLHIGANLVNDYYDYLRGIDTTNSLGPGGLIQQGFIRPRRVLNFGLTMLGLGALCGLLLALSSGGPLLLAAGLIGFFCAYFYSATARSLASIALGEMVSFAIFGPALTLIAYFVQVGQFSRLVFIYSLPLGLLACAFIFLNNMRDSESDAQAGKHTLVSLLGLRASRAIYALLLLGAYAPIIILGVPSHAPHLLLITLWTLPGLVVLLSGVLRTYAPASLHWHMRKTLSLEIQFTLLLLIALIVTTYVTLVHLPTFTLPF